MQNFQHLPTYSSFSYDIPLLISVHGIKFCCCWCCCFKWTKHTYTFPDFSMRCLWTIAYKTKTVFIVKYLARKPLCSSAILLFSSSHQDSRYLRCEQNPFQAYPVMILLDSYQECSYRHRGNNRTCPCSGVFTFYQKYDWKVRLKMVVSVEESSLSSLRIRHQYLATY